MRGGWAWLGHMHGGVKKTPLWQSAWRTRQTPIAMAVEHRLARPVPDWPTRVGDQIESAGREETVLKDARCLCWRVKVTASRGFKPRTVTSPGARAQDPGAAGPRLGPRWSISCMSRV